MFTVIIAEKKHIDRMRKNILFTDVFKDDSKFAFCPWNIGETTLEKALPTLYECVGRRQKWNAILFTNALDANSKNPFDVTKFSASSVEYARKPGMSNEELEALREEAFNGELNRRKAAYKKAVEDNPLATLLQMLCEKDKSEDRKEYDLEREEELDRRAVNEDLYYKMYYETNKAKEDILKKCLITKSKVTRPSMVLCLAPRIFQNDHYELVRNWKSNDEINYSQFCEYNLYPNNCRFALFDLVSDEHILYQKYYLQLLVVLFVFATVEVKANLLQPDKLYRINSEYNDEAFGQLFYDYERKLSLSCQAIDKKIIELQTYRTDPRAKNNYESKEIVRLNLAKYFQPIGTKVRFSGVRLASNVPNDEKKYWEEKSHESEKALNIYLKQPRRIIAEGVEESLSTPDLDEDDILTLDKFKVEDLKEIANESEGFLSSIEKKNIFDAVSYKKRLKKKSDKVLSYMNKRMTLKKIISAIILLMLAIIISSGSAMFYNLTSAKAQLYSLQIIMWIVIAILLIVIVPLIVFRIILGFRIKDYNSEIKSIINEIEEETKKYETYLSNVKTYRKCNRVEKVFEKGGIIKKIKINNLKMHNNIIEKHIEKCENLLNSIYTGEFFDDRNDLEAYAFDFTKDTEYEYELPLREKDSTTIDYVYKGNKAEIPINFIDNILITREDIYD